MTLQETVGQIVGTGALFLFALVIWRIALFNGKSYARYGREALACCAGIFSLSTATVSLSLADIISPARSREINLLAFVVALAIMAQTGIIALLTMRNESKRRKT